MTRPGIVFEQDPDGGPGVVRPTAFAQAIRDDAKDALALIGPLGLTSDYAGPMAAAVFTEIRAERERRQEFVARCD